MKRIFSVSAILLLSLTSQAQVGNLLNKAKNKVQQRTTNAVDAAMDKGLDKAEQAIVGGKPKPGTTSGTQSGNTSNEAASQEATGGPEPKAKLTANSKFDFVPGDKVLYSEDFAQDNIGELPLTWNSSGKGEVMTIDGKEGRWIRGYQGGLMLAGNKVKMGENYTIEFDMIHFFQPKLSGYLLPDLMFGVYGSGSADAGHNSFLRNHRDSGEINFTIHSANKVVQAISYVNKQKYFESDRVDFTNWENSYNKVVHYALQVQKTRVRLWADGVKLFDIPRALDAGQVMNNIYFEMQGSNYTNDEIGYYVGNIKVATGLPDTRHKLMNEGRFSTTGILFNVSSADIKAESNGVIKEIAAVLKENPTVKIKIVGHTSNDGDAATNLKLSNDRAAAVKAALVKDYGIDETRIITEGKGSAQPVGDNKTPEGRTQNRRVEFIKL